MDDKRIEEIYKDSKCKEQAECTHDCSNCSVARSEPGMWKVYLGLATVIVLIALAVKYIGAFLGAIF